ncbi:hypothetical protein [Pseudarthrobacter sulfonivorans]|uniref:hypothetical protein n=1 Tax=Pseudarthrobacter sulfonivorans TaxID=121292 RepID=UPI00277EAEA2|nr:hypothetical protein [Pseudarthrobacter sulfonivorans]MDP9998277.1 hypothetical protein [Pseudarthrobacter sulfonivorans]
MKKMFAAGSLAAVLALTACGGSDEGTSVVAVTTPSLFTVNQSCEQLFIKGDEGRLMKAIRALTGLPAEVTITNVTSAVIAAGDLEFVSGTANEEMKPLIEALVSPLKAVAPGPNTVQPAEVEAAESRILDACPAQAKDYEDDKAVEVARAKAEADIAARKAAEAASAKAAADAATAAAAAPKEYSGAGDDIVSITKHGTGAQVAIIQHTGSSNFAVHTLDSTMDTTDLLVNEIGNYSGTVLFDARDRDETKALRITASGPWTVKLVPLTSVRSFDGSAPMTGRGDDVFAYTGSAKPATFTHDGSSNIAVKSYGTRTSLLINEIGAYTGTVVWSPGFYTVTADGNWSATLK